MAFEQDPDARVDYPVNWTTFLDGATLESSTWIPEEPSIVTVDEDSFTDTASLAFVAFTGAVVGTKYKVVNRIVDSRGRIEDHTIEIKIKEH